MSIVAGEDIVNLRLKEGWKENRSKSLTPPLICILKKHPSFFIDFENFTPLPTLNTGPPLGINNEQYLKPFVRTSKGIVSYCFDSIDQNY